MGVKEEFEKALNKAYPKKNVDYINGETWPINEALWGAQWAFEKAANEVCGHDDNFQRYKDCCDYRDRIRQLGESLK